MSLLALKPELCDVAKQFADYHLEFFFIELDNVTLPCGLQYITFGSILIA